jgi:hypothetical protein
MPSDRPRLALLALSALCGTFAHAQAPPDGPEEQTPWPDRAAEGSTTPDDRRHAFTFGELPGAGTDRLLEGMDASDEVVVPIPGAWELASDAVLRLHFDHSSALDPARSHLTVLVNGQPVGTVTLDATNGIDGHVVLQVPRALLQPWTHVGLRASQHATRGCEDPFDPSLWTRIRATSSLEVPYAPRPVTPDLARLPFPFVDETAEGPARIALALGESPSPATVAAAGRLGLTLGRLAAYRGVEVAPPFGELAQVDAHALVVGLPDENPLVRALVPDLRLGPGEGWVAMRANPADPTLAALVVTGADSEGLARAVAAVAGRQRREVLAGTDVRVVEARDAAPPARRELPAPAPGKATFHLSELGLSDRTVRGFHTPAIHVPFGLEGDAVVRPGGARADLRYAYAAGLDPALSALEVKLDGITVATLPLDAARGASMAEASVSLPDEVLRPDSALRLVFHLFPKDFDTCRYASDRTLWGTVYASSALHVARDRVGRLPELAGLANGAWPYTLEPGRGETVLVVPDQPTREEVGAGFAIAAMLGRTSTADAPDLRMLTAGGHTFDGLRSHLFLIGTGTPHALRDALARDGRLRAPGSPDLLDEDRAALLAVEGRAAPVTIEQLLHPSDATRAVTVISAPGSGAALRSAVAALTVPERTALLEGTLAILEPDGTTRAMRLHETRQVGSPAVGVALQGLLRRNYLLLGAAVVVGGFGIAAVRRAWARERGGR